MKFRRVCAVARKETLHVVRDPRSLALALLIPVLLLVLFGYALTVDVDNVPLVVWDQSRSDLSRGFIARFDGSPYFRVARYVDNYRDLEAELDSRRVLGGLVVGPRFAEQIRSGSEAPVQLVLDGTDSNTATIALGYAEALTQMYTLDRIARQARSAGTTPPRINLELRSRVWFNEDLVSRNYIVPGLIAVIMMVIAALLTSLTVAGEWERGTMEQLLSTPVKGPELILGKMIPYFIIGMFDLFVAVMMGQFLFQVPLRGNVALVFIIAAVFLAGALSMGMLISIIAKHQLLASQLAIVTTFLPAFLLSGFMISIQHMPTPVQWITCLVPARYFVEILHAVYLKGVGLEVVGLEAAVLTLFGAVVFTVANAAFKKRLG